MWILSSLLSLSLTLISHDYICITLFKSHFVASLSLCDLSHTWFLASIRHWSPSTSLECWNLRLELTSPRLAHSATPAPWSLMSPSAGRPQTTIPPLPRSLTQILTICSLCFSVSSFPHHILTSCHCLLLCFQHSVLCLHPDPLPCTGLPALTGLNQAY